MTYFAGIDGGQTATVVAIGDEHGTLAHGHGPAADLVGESSDSQRQLRALQIALAAALVEANLPPRTRFAGIVAGISGFEVELSPIPDLSAYAERTRIVHDTEIAHAGALGGGDGIVVIAGTGSVALGNSVPGKVADGDGAPRPFVRAGGWGYFFGDEGSATWIARVALGRAMAREDRGRSSALAMRAAKFFGAPSLRAIQHAFAHGDLGRVVLASFARDVLACANAGDDEAQQVRDEAAAALADLCATVDARLPPAAVRSISYAGGLFADEPLRTAFRRSVERAVPHASVRAPKHTPAEGALALARRSM